MNVSYCLEFPESLSRGIRIICFICVRTRRAPPNLHILAHYL